MVITSMDFPDSRFHNAYTCWGVLNGLEKFGETFNTVCATSIHLFLSFELYFFRLGRCLADMPPFLSHFRVDI